MFLHRLRQIPLVLLFALCFATTCARAWNPPGHMVIGLIAYAQLDDATKAKALALLHAHPRYEDHFARAQKRAVEKGTEAEKEQWLFAFAATWSDIVRSASSGGSAARFTGAVVNRDDVEKYNRPLWHYIDEPVYLSEAEGQILAPTIRVNRKRELTEDRDDKDMNVIQAIKNSSRILADKNASEAVRSVHLCWMLHLVGDAHQPLHSSALFTTRRYPEGDHGGNYLFYSHEFPLHAYWDDVICTEEAYDTVRLVAGQLAQNAELAAAGNKPAAQLDPGAWIDEGHAIAKEYVYTPEVREKVASREGHTHLGDLNLSPQYEAEAERVSEQQAVVAGHRLAKLLQELLK